MEGSARPLVGRDPELRVIAEAVEGDRSIFVTGEAGIGKTSLVRNALAAGDRRVFEGGGFATLDWLPYLALRRALGVPLTGDPANVAAQLEREVGPDVLFVDDVQWVDADSLAAIELALGRILIVGAIRTGDARSDEALRVARGSAADVLELGGLADDAAATIVRRAQPRLSPEAAGGIVRRAAGNPLLLEELAIAGTASSALRRALTSRVELLSSAGRDTVELLAIADEPLLVADAGQGVTEAIETGLARRLGDAVEIRHALVAEAVREGLGDGRTRTLHGTLAGVARDSLQRTRHLGAAGEARAAVAAARAGLPAATDPRDRAALLVIAAQAAPPNEGLAMRIEAARSLDEAADWPGVLHALGAAGSGDGADGVELAASPEELLAEREALLAHATYALGEPARCRELLERARSRELGPGSPAAIRTAVELATYRVNVEGDVDGALRVLDAAAGAAAPGSSGATAAVRVLRESIALLGTGAGDVAAVHAGLEAAFAAGEHRTATDRARVVQYLLLMGSSAEAALAFLLEQRTRFQAAGVRAAAIDFLADAVTAAMLAGRLEESGRLADELFEQPASRRILDRAASSGARAQTLLGAFDAAAARIAGRASEVAPDFFGQGELLAAQADLAFWSGRPEAAGNFADASLRIPAPISGAAVQPMLTRAWARVELGLDPGTLPDARLPPSLAGAAPEMLGLRAWLDGDPDAAAAQFDAAAAAWGSFHVPAALRARWAAAESRRVAGATARAVDELTATLGDAEAIGFQPLSARLRRSLRLAGVRTSSPVPRGAPSAGGLTPRERELTLLVERGLTNMEIARRLGLGRPTVARILASAMSKLGVTTRAQLAATAASAVASSQP